jgi:hypothetical protein
MCDRFDVLQTDYCPNPSLPSHRRELLPVRPDCLAGGETVPSGFRSQPS